MTMNRDPCVLDPRANRRFGQLALLSGLAFFVAAPAFADKIDGQWCSAPEVRHMSIDGPKIITPGGTHTTGNYSRHAFSYIVPDSDPGAGQEIDMRLLNEEEVQVIEGDGPPAIWRRCDLNV